MPEIRYTSKQNRDAGKFEILRITDNPDSHAAESVEVVAQFDTWPECVEAQRRVATMGTVSSSAEEASGSRCRSVPAPRA
jgi:hypothetical protein